MDETLLDAVVSRRVSVKKGEVLTDPSMSFEAVFSVKSGAFKTLQQVPGQRTKIIGFHFPGELVGLEAIDARRHHYTVEALVNSSVCELHMGKVGELAERSGEFQQEMILAMSRRILHDQQMQALLGVQSAERRIAAFLYSVATRMNAGHGPATEFRLPMLREDVGNYLGLAVETVSRMLSQFSQRGIASLQGRNVTISDLPALREMAGHEEPPVLTSPS